MYSSPFWSHVRGMTKAWPLFAKLSMQLFVFCVIKTWWLIKFRHWKWHLAGLSAWDGKMRNCAFMCDLGNPWLKNIVGKICQHTISMYIYLKASHFCSRIDFSARIRNTCNIGDRDEIVGWLLGLYHRFDDMLKALTSKICFTLW